MAAKLVLLGTGTPNACLNASGPASAVVVDDKAYLVDFGPGGWSDKRRRLTARGLIPCGRTA